jgi:hypothetical protein
MKMKKPHIAKPAVRKMGPKPHIRMQKLKPVPASAFPTAAAAFPPTAGAPSPGDAMGAPPGGMPSGAAPGDLTE